VSILALFRTCIPALVAAGLVPAPAAAATVAGAETVEPARFHHVHLNVVDPAASIEFYRRIFGAQPLSFRGRADAAYTERSFLLFQRVAEPAPSAASGGIWHIGWGGVDVPSEYRWLVQQGVEIHTPLYALGRGHVVYLKGPDDETIEVNTMGHHRFAHVHLLAEDPNRTAAWYGEHFGLPPRRTAGDNPRPVGEDAAYRTWQEFHAEHRAWSNGFRCDNVSFVVYNVPDYEPPPPWWREPSLARLVSQRGRVIDHFAFSYRDIEPVHARLVAAGVPILAPIREQEELGLRSFFVQAPDGVVLEVVEAEPIPEGAWD
jgi:catechol 2,3-dioxygenase-like lactoylglutathione lyase family enzyme